MADQRLGFGRIPLGGTDKPADFLAFRIQDQRCRKAECAGTAARLAALVVDRRKASDRILIKEFCHLLHPLQILSDGENGEIIAAKFCLQPVKARHFLAAGGAPCRPEIHNEHPTPVVGKLLFRARRIQEGEILDGPRFVIGREFRHLARQQRVEILRESS